jgi:uncharacterized protein YcgI (DUF1989 family)
VIATVRLNDHQLELAQRMVAARWPGRSLPEAMVDALVELRLHHAAPAGPPEHRPVPPHLGRTRVDLLVEPGEGCGLVIGAGEVLRILQVDDGQGVDLIAYDASALRRRFSAARTRMRCGARPGLGATLWSGPPDERALMTIVSDSSGPHDLTFPACSRFEYRSYGGFEHHPNCFDIQTAVVDAWGLRADEVPDPLNLWLPAWCEDDGTLHSAPTSARNGDHVDLRAERDVLVAVNPCADDVFGSSRWELQAVRVLVRPASGAPTPNDAAPVIKRRRFPAPRVHEIPVEVPPWAARTLESLERRGDLGTSAGTVLRAAFFTVWRQELRARAAPGEGF